MTERAVSSPSAPSLIEAIRRAYAVELHTPPFEERLLELTRALITCPWAAVLDIAEGEIAITAGQVPSEALEPVAHEAEKLLSANGAADVVVAGPGFVARIAIPGGGVRALAMGRAQGGQVAQSLAYERLTLLAAMSFAQNAHPDQVAQADLLEKVAKLADAPSADQMQALADRLARHMNADYAALAWSRDGAVHDLVISGQDGAAKRASLPDKLRADMRDTARSKAQSTERLFAGRGDDGLVLHVEGATRNLHAPQLIGAAYLLNETGVRASRWGRARWMKIGVWALVLIGVGLIPVPDRVEIPATVEAAERRVVTAPFTGRLERIAQTDSATVTEGAVLLALGTDDIDLDLIEARAEMARALLEREAARAARLPADLRNAELEVERLEARLARLAAKIEDATLTAPIAGLVIAPDLAEKLGTTVRQGDPLLEVADPAEMRLRLAIPDNRLGLIAPDLEGQFRPDYDPTLSFEARVQEISPAVSVRDETPVLDGRADLEGSTEGLRPGLRGVFAPQSQWRPAALLAYEAIRNWVLLRVWL